MGWISFGEISQKSLSKIPLINGGVILSGAANLRNAPFSKKNIKRSQRKFKFGTVSFFPFFFGREISFGKNPTGSIIGGAYSQKNFLFCWGGGGGKELRQELVHHAPPAAVVGGPFEN